MCIIAVPIYRFRVATSTREINAWVNLVECSVRGCDYVRALKYGQDGPRNRNRKGGPK